MWVQQGSNPFWDALFLTLTRLGDMSFFVLVFPYLYWNWNSKAALRLMTIFLVSAVVTYFLKDFFAFPRPDPSLVKTYGLPVSPMESFPSGHAVGATVFWGYLAWYVKKPRIIFIGAAMVALVSFSRIYLGVHFPGDILGGTALGAALLLIYIKLEKTLTPGVWNIIWIIFAVLVAVFYRQFRAVQAMAILFGIRAGAPLEEKFAGYKPAPGLFAAFLKYAVGLVCFFIFYKMMRQFPGAANNFFWFVLFAFGGFYLAFLYPWFLARFLGRPHDLSQR